MSAKKTTSFADVTNIADLYEKIDALQAENSALELEIGDLRKENERLMKECISFEDRYGEEHKKRMHERDEASKAKAELECKIKFFTDSIDVTKKQIAYEKKQRHASIPKFVIVAAASMVVMMAAFMLQKADVLDPSVGFGIQTATAMVIAWCYATIWDRSRK